MHPGHAVSGTAGRAPDRKTSGTAGGPQRAQGPAVRCRTAGLRHPVALACGRECRGAVQLPHLRTDADNSAAGADRAGEYPFGVYVTSPDYLGGMQDIRALSAVCDTFGMPLLVDNAHGAYLRFLPGEPLHPIALGAAMCCDSAHKTLPVVTGGAYLHLGENAPVQEEAAVRGALALFGSTSPSYLILQSLDACNRQLTESYPAGLQRCCARLAALRGELNAAAQAAAARCRWHWTVRAGNR